jgi:hypothetical protein
MGLATRGRINTLSIYAIGLPLIAYAIWGIFRVPNDPGKSPVAKSGVIRLAYEVVFFGFAT